MHEQRRSGRTELAARRAALDTVCRSLIEIASSNRIADEIVQQLNARHEHRSSQLHDPEKELAAELFLLSGQMHRQLIDEERRFLHAMLRDGKITDETRRRIERDLDLEEASIGNREHGGMPL